MKYIKTFSKITENKKEDIYKYVLNIDNSDVYISENFSKFRSLNSSEIKKINSTVDNNTTISEGYMVIDDNIPFVSPKKKSDYAIKILEIYNEEYSEEMTSFVIVDKDDYFYFFPVHQHIMGDIICDPFVFDQLDEFCDNIENIIDSIKDVD